jgi:uncharacterized protein YbaR (Trm112 family)
MIKHLKRSLIVRYLTCPYCFNKSRLVSGRNSFWCKECKRHYKYKNNIIRFINPKELDKETSRELKGNSFALSKKNIDHYALKDNWSDYYNFFVEQKIKHLLFYLDQTKCKTIASLGSGPGFELKEILKKRKISLVLSSDLALSATSVVPVTLKHYDTTLCLFTSDLRLSPVVSNNSVLILVYEALHHTGDIHGAINTLLQKKYKHIIIVEPCTNFLIRILAKFGVAQREEYSGVIPDFLDIRTLRNLCKKNNYQVQVNTIWEIPEGYFRLIVKRGSILEKFILRLIMSMSVVTNIFGVGSFAIAYLNKK